MNAERANYMVKYRGQNAGQNRNIKITNSGEDQKFVNSHNKSRTADTMKLRAR